MAYSPPACAWWTCVSITSNTTSAADGQNGTCCVDSVRQSRNSAVSGCASSDTAWSITPTGAPTTSCSARCAATASAIRSTSTLASSARASATAHSSAALEDSPAPTGTSESTTTSSPCTPTSSRIAHATPAAYASHPSAVGAASVAMVVHPPSPSCADQPVTLLSARRPTATTADCSIATGRTSPSL